MIRNFLTTAWRNILKYKSYALINFVGLTCGIGLALLVFTYVRNEFSFDRFHPDIDRIYRIAYTAPNGLQIAACPPPIAPRMTEFFPEVEYAARMFGRNVSIAVPGKEETSTEETNVFFVDSGFVDIFHLQLKKGNAKRMLAEPFTLVLNEEMAKKYFGDENPIGQSLLFAGQVSFTVVAVVADFPPTSHVHFNMLVPYDNMFDLEASDYAEQLRQNLEINFIISHSYTYVKLKPGADPAGVDQRFSDFLKKYAQPSLLRGQVFNLMPVKDIHLHSTLRGEPENTNTITNIYIFIGIGILTLLIACINYVNLATAQSFSRIKEIGLRKILGSDRWHLISQFMMESLLFGLVAMALSYVLVYFALPYLNLLTGSRMVFGEVIDLNVIMASLILLLIVTMMAGGYPSYFVTRFDSVQALKGSGTSMISGNGLRKGLVTFQLMITCMLLSASLMVMKQLKYLQNRPLGFRRDNIITIPLQSQNFNSVFATSNEQQLQRLETFRNQIEKLSAVKATALSSNAPGLGIVFRGIIPEGFTENDNLFGANLGVDFDFQDTYELELAAGRFFDRAYGTDLNESFIVNETAVREYKWGSPDQAIGKQIILEGKKGVVVGVVRDFNFLSLTNAIPALTIDMRPGYGVLSVRMANDQVQENIETLREEWNRLFPEKTFEFQFLDQQLNQQYANFQNFGHIIEAFTVIAILISCLGVYGLILFIAHRKVKEIGIRKVLGASVSGVLRLILSEFVLLLVIGFLLAIPASYYLISRWLDNFTYHTSIDMTTYTISFLIVAIMVLMTVAHNTLRAAFANPVNSIRMD